MSVLTELLAPDTYPAVDENWRGQAPCARTDPDAWFKDASSKSEFEKKICGRCPISVLCLGLALELEDDPNVKAWGVWGGLDATERRALTAFQRDRLAREAKRFRFEADQEAAAA